MGIRSIAVLTTGRQDWGILRGTCAELRASADFRLTVLAGHAVVRNDLFIHRQLIVERIRKLPGCTHVRELNIRAG